MKRKGREEKEKKEMGGRRDEWWEKVRKTEGKTKSLRKISYTYNISGWRNGKNKIPGNKGELPLKGFGTFFFRGEEKTLHGTGRYVLE
jgi:hypothetical protein